MRVALPALKSRCIIHVRYSPSSTSSSFFLSRLSQFLQLSQLTAAIFQSPPLPPPSGKHAQQLNNFSIYMHGGIRYHPHAFAANTRRGRGERPVVSIQFGASTACNHCQDHTRGIQILSKNVALSPGHVCATIKGAQGIYNSLHEEKKASLIL